MTRRSIRANLLLALAAMVILAVPTTASASLSSAQKKAIQKVGSDAYIYGYAPVYMSRNVNRFPQNMVLNVQYLATDLTRTVVKPNADTLYTIMVLDLSSGPIIIHTPPTGSRYFALELLDSYTNVTGYIGNRTTGSAGGNYALVGPNWNQTTDPLKRSVSSTIHATTNLVWVIGRTLVDNQADVPNALAIQDGITAQRNSAVDSGTFLPGLNLSKPGDTAPTPIAMLPNAAFFKEFGTVTKSQAPPAADATLLKGLKKYGIGPALDPNKTQSAAVIAELVKGAVAGQAKIDAGLQTKKNASLAKRNGWILFDGVGVYGKDYLTRAIIAELGIGANKPEEAIYPAAVTDYAGQTLNGSGGAKYKIHFAAGQLPPNNAFWSITMYAQDQFFIPNSLGRFAIGDRTPGTTLNTDGSQDIIVSAAQPSTALRGTANWLPAPEAQFNVMLRIYLPKSSVLKGTWKYPKITKLP